MTIHVDRSNVDELLSRHTYLRVFAACDPTAVMAEGEFIAYAAAPTVVLRHRDGTKSSWQTTLPMEEIAPPPAPAVKAAPPGHEPSGPYELERDTDASPLLREVAGVTPGRGAYELIVMRHLVGAARAANVDLGAYDVRVLSWLADRAPETAQVVIGLVSRAYAAGQKEGRERGDS